MPKISLLYDYEIDSIAQEKSLSLLPLVHHVLSNWPDADWKDVAFTISEHVKTHGLKDFPDEVLAAPVVEDILVDLPPQVSDEDDYLDLELFTADDEDEPEPVVENTLIHPKKVERVVDVRQILQQVKRGNL